MKKIFFYLFFILLFSNLFCEPITSTKNNMFTTTNLRLRENESLDSKIITTMKEGAYVSIYKIGKLDTIDNITSNWVCINVIFAEDIKGKELQKSLKGWCFGGYLSTSFESIYYKNIKSPEVWTFEEQIKKYDDFFTNKKDSEILEFYDYIKSIQKYHHYEPVYIYNPIFLCFDKYPEYLDYFLKNRIELFTHGNIEYSNYLKSPFIYVLQNKSLQELKYFYDNKISNLFTKEEFLYGSLERGGSRFGIGGNFLLYTDDMDKIKYLISKGVPKTANAPSDFDYLITEDNVKVYDNPGFDKNVIHILNKNEIINGIKITTFKINNFQWLYISHEDIKGWIVASRDYGFDYDGHW